jgi:antitoxin PrlF
MAPSSTLSSKGQITVPLAIRHRLGLKARDRVEFYIDYGRTIIRPMRLAENPFEKYIGILPVFVNKRRINKWLRTQRDSQST